MLDRIALVLLIIGGLNWGLLGLFGFDLVAFIFCGQGAVISRLVSPDRDICRKGACLRKTGHRRRVCTGLPEKTDLLPIDGRALQRRVRKGGVLPVCTLFASGRFGSAKGGYRFFKGI